MSALFTPNKKKCSCKINECKCKCLIRKIVKYRPNVLSKYLRYKEIEDYLRYIETSYGSFVRIHTIGKSWNAHLIRAIVIHWGNKNQCISVVEKTEMSKQVSSSPLLHLPLEQRKRSTVLIEAGTHGCEWIAISTALYCVQQLIEYHRHNRNLLRKFRFVIIPLSNPDGYEISQRKRKWRQNLNGIDCNRNYDINWSEGCSCKTSNTYRGAYPFSEPETRAMRNILRLLGPQLLMVISLHSYAQSILFPWGYKRELPAGFEHLKTVGNVGRSAISRYSGRKYRMNSIYNSFKRKISGSLVDYAYDIVKVPFSLCIELPSRKLGFQPAEKHIAHLVAESWRGITKMCESALNELPKMASRNLLYPSERLSFISNLEKPNVHLFDMDLEKWCASLENSSQKF